MEKFRNKSNSRPCNRLLTAFFINLFFLITLAAQNQHKNNFSDLYTAGEISEKKDLHFEFIAAENQNFFVNEDLYFYLNISDLNPTQIELKSYNLPKNVQLKMFKKTENYENNGTLINLWLNFKETGVYELENFVFLLKNRNKNLEINVKFPKITIKNDISKEFPKIVIAFENGKKIYYDEKTENLLQMQESKIPILQINEGEKLSFTVYVQFAKKILGFNYEIPKNVIFKQTDFFDYKNYNKEFSDEFEYNDNLQPLARFELTGLTNGIEEFPCFFIQTENYQGKKEEIKFKGFFIEFLKNDRTETIAEKEIYNEIFSQINETENQIKTDELTYEECKKIAKKLKRDYIKKLVFVFLPIFAVFLVIFFILLKKVKFKKTVTAIFVAFFLILLSCFVALCYKNKNGIFLGGKIYAIPDENSKAQNEYSAGKKIKLLERTEKWFYIQTEEEISGWCKKENVII